MSKCFSLFCLFFFGATCPLLANHLVGAGWMTYEAADSGRTLVKVFVVHDCDGIAMSHSNLVVRAGSVVHTVPPDPNTTKVTDISPIGFGCNVTSSCAGGSLPIGYQLYEFQYLVRTDTFTTCGIHFSWEQCCHTGIGNVATNTEPIYFYSIYYQCQGGIGQGLEVINNPYFFMYHNTNNYHALMVSDSANAYDSISYELTTVQVGYNTNATYMGGYTYNRPFSQPGFPSTISNLVLDPVTGNMKMRPTAANQVSAIAYKIKGWKRISGNMELVSELYMEEPVIVRSLQNDPPEFSGSTSYEFCQDQTNCFVISASDPNNGDTVRYRIRHSVPGLTVTNISTDPLLPSLEFCWTPVDSSADLENTIVRVEFYDNFCPELARSTRNIRLRVLPPVDSSFIPLVNYNGVCNGAVLTFQDTAQSGMTFLWEYEGQEISNDSLVISASDTGWIPYRYGYKWLGCSLWIQDSVYQSQYSAIKMNADTFASPFCTGDSVMMRVRPSGGLAPYQVSWAAGSTVDSQLVVLQGSNLFPVQVEDAHGCVLYDTLKLKTYPLFTAQPEDILLCRQMQPATIDLEVVISGGTGPFEVEWTGFGTGNSFPIPPPLNDTAIRVTVTDSFSCSLAATLYITRYQALEPDAGPDQTRCGPGTLMVLAQDNHGQNSMYEWLGYGQGRLAYPYVTDSVYAVLLFTDFFGCKTYDTAFLKAFENPEISLPADTNVCLGESVNLLSTAVKGKPPYSYEWTGVTSNLASATLKVTANHVISVKVTDANSCSDIDTLRVLAKSIPQVSLAPILPLCANAQVISLATKGTPSGGAWQGAGVGAVSGQYRFDPAQAGAGVHRIYYVYTSPLNGCAKTDSLNVEVLALPNVAFSAPVTKGKPPLVVDFTNQSDAVGSGGYYLWNFGVPLTGADTSRIFEPAFTYDKKGLYTVTLKVNNGNCSSELVKTGYIEVEPPLGLNTASSEGITAYPNPFSKSLRILTAEDILAIEVYDLSGRKMSFEWNEKNKELTPRNWVEGAYVVRIQTEAGNKRLLLEYLP